MNALSICIMLVIYGRMIEVYLTTSVGPIPLATMTNQMCIRDRVCVIRYLGRVSKGQMRGIDEAVRIQLGYYIPEQAEKKRQGKCRKDGEEGDG